MGIFRRITEKMQEIDQAREDIDDDKTKDRHLRSLRRHDRVQNEELEKERLKKKIRLFEQRRANLLATGNTGQSTSIKKKINVKKRITQEKQFMIPKRKPKKSMLSKGFL